MKFQLSFFLFMAALFPSFGQDTSRSLPSSDQEHNDGGIVFPTSGMNNFEGVTLEETAFNETKISIREEARDLAHRYPAPRYHRKHYGYTTYHSTKGYDAKGLYGKGGGKGGNGTKGKGKGMGKGKGYSFSRSQYSFPSNKGKGHSSPRSQYSFPRSKGKGVYDTKGKGGKGKGKGTRYSGDYSRSRSKGKGEGTSSASSEDSFEEEHEQHDIPSSACREIVFEIAQKWDESAILEPGGVLVDSVRDASVHPGQRWPFSGPVMWSSDGRHTTKKNDNNVVGSNAEMCTRVNHGEMWYCHGTLQLDLHDPDDAPCKGQLTFSGSFSDDDLRGKYTIVGGTGAFLGARGQVIDDFDYNSLYSIRQIYIQ